MTSEFRDGHFDQAMRGWRRIDLRQALLRIADHEPRLVAEALDVPDWWLWSDAQVFAQQTAILSWYQELYGQHGLSRGDVDEFANTLHRLMLLNTKFGRNGQKAQATKNDLAILHLIITLQKRLKGRLGVQFVLSFGFNQDGSCDPAIIRAAAQTHEFASVKEDLLRMLSWRASGIKPLE